LSACSTTYDRYQKTEISQVFCAEMRWRHHVLNGFLRRSRPSISMTTDASLNARRLGAIDRPLASPYSTSEIPVSLSPPLRPSIVSSLTSIPKYWRYAGWWLCCHDNSFTEIPLRFLVHANYFVCRERLMLRMSSALRIY